MRTVSVGFWEPPRDEGGQGQLGQLFQWLRGRGLDGVKLIVGDKCMGMLEAVGEVSPRPHQ